MHEADSLLSRSTRIKPSESGGSHSPLVMALERQIPGICPDMLWTRDKAQGCAGWRADRNPRKRLAKPVSADPQIAIAFAKYDEASWIRPSTFSLAQKHNVSYTHCPQEFLSFSRFFRALPVTPNCRLKPPRLLAKPSFLITYLTSFSGCRSSATTQYHCCLPKATPQCIFFLQFKQQMPEIVILMIRISLHVIEFSANPYRRKCCNAA